MKITYLKKLIVWAIVLALTVTNVGVTMASELIAPIPSNDASIAPLPVIELPEPENTTAPEPPPSPIIAPVTIAPPQMNPIEDEVTNTLEDVPNTQEPPAQQPVTYTIRYVYFDGEAEQAFSVLVTDAETIEKPDFIPTREGHMFTFWYDDAGAPVLFTFGRAPERDMILKAYFLSDGTTPMIAPVEPTDGDAPTDDPQEGDDPDDLPEIIEEDGEPEPLFENLSNEAPRPEISVAIASDAGEYAAYGDTITLTAQLTGLDGLEYTANWQYFDGADWHTAPSDGGLVYQYTFAEENAGWSWRLEIVVHQSIEPADQAGGYIEF